MLQRLILLLVVVSLIKAQTTKSETNDTTKIKPKADTLRLIKSFPVNSNENSFKISLESLKGNPYRFAGNQFEFIPFSFLKYNIPGQPSSLSIAGNNEIGYLDNGISLNNFFNNSFNLNEIQTEIIDSVFVSRLYDGFLYTDNNQIAINFDTRRTYSQRPYTKLRFTQAPAEDAYVDFIFNAFLSKRLSLHFELAHSHADSVYSNDYSSYWLGTVRANYILTNFINITGSYRNNKGEFAQNGGMIDSAGVNIFNETESVPNFKKRYQKSITSYFDLGANLRFDEKHIWEIKTYYYETENQYRDNEYSGDKNIRLFNNYVTKKNGLYFNIPLSVNFMLLQLNGKYEYIKIRNEINEKTYSSGYNYFTFSPRLFFKLGNFNLSGFAKYSLLNTKSYLGFGGDLNITLLKSFKIFGGISFFEKPLNPAEMFIDNSSLPVEYYTVQGGIQFMDDQLNGELSVFFSRISNQLFAYGEVSRGIKKYYTKGLIRENSEKSGVSAVVNFKIRRFEINSNLVYQYSNSIYKYTPSYNLNLAIYYRDTLFNKALDLKAGIKVEFWGKIPYYAIDNQLNNYLQYYQNPNSNEFSRINNNGGKNFFKLDIISASKIKRNAQVYISLENLLGLEYEKEPFYPGRGRSLIVGINWEFFD